MRLTQTEAQPAVTRQSVSMGSPLSHRIYRSRAFTLVRPIWRLGKRSYHGFQDRVFGGVSHQCGPATIRVPSEYSYLWRAREQYPETEPLTRVHEWCLSHPTGTVLDVGSEIGRFSLLALSA